MKNDKLLTIKEARKSTCINCDSFKCCSLLALTKYPLLSLSDLDVTAYYLNFSDIIVILDRGGECHIYYSKACRFFNKESKTCSVHNQPLQSATCVYYNPYRCFYKKVNDDKHQIQHGHIWLDHERLNYISGRIGFDEKRNIVQMPDYTKLVEEFNSSIPYNRSAEPFFTEKEESVFVKNDNVCRKCSASCCKKILIQSNIPLNIGSIDFYSYSVNFPGIQYLISDDGWVMLVDSRCKYLNKNNKCSIVDKNERPLRCHYMNPLQCNINYKINRSGQIKADFNNFEKIKKGIKTDNDGNVVSIESTENLQKLISE